MTREEKRELKKLLASFEKLSRACASLRLKVAKAGGEYSAQVRLSEASVQILGAAAIVDNQIRNDLDGKSAAARTVPLPFK